MASNTASLNPQTAVDSEGLSHSKRIEYLRKYGLREVRKVACGCVLSGARKCIDRDVECHAPDWDHPAMFKCHDTRELVLVYQPYFPKDQTEDYLERFTQRVEAWAANWRFTARVSVEESFHYPGRTVLVELRKAVR
jgi:hypothetical protein